MMMPVLLVQPFFRLWCHQRAGRTWQPGSIPPPSAREPGRLGAEFFQDVSVKKDKKNPKNPQTFFLFPLPLYLAECDLVVKFLLAVGIFWRMHVLSISLYSAVTQPAPWEENVPCFWRQCCRHLWFGAHLGQFKCAIVNSTGCKIRGPCTSCSSTLLNTACFLASIGTAFCYCCVRSISCFLSL